MSRPELSMTPQAQVTLLACNTKSGALPRGTTDEVRVELQEAGYIGPKGMTIRGRAARGRLLDDAVEAL